MKDIIIKILANIVFQVGFIGVIYAENPPVVGNYYSSIKKLSSSDESEAFDLVNNIMYCFAGHSQGNSSGFSGIDIVDNLTTTPYDTVPSNVFAQRLKRAVFDNKKLRLLDFKLGQPEYSMQPKLTEEGEVKLCQTNVVVKYINSNQIINERTEFLGIVDNRIVSISTNKMNMDVVGLTLEAAELYTKKRYQEAYKTYRQILDIESDNINALYRLGIMTAKGQGVKKNYREARDLFKRASSTIKRSKTTDIFDFYTIRRKAEEAYYHLTHNSVV